MPPPVVPPAVVALLTGAGFHEDDAGKAYLLGVFSGYTAPRFPATMAKFFVYVALTDGHGQRRSRCGWWTGPTTARRRCGRAT